MFCDHQVLIIIIEFIVNGLIDLRMFCRGGLKGVSFSPSL